MMIFRLFSLLCLATLLVACTEEAPKKRPPAKPKLTMDACARLPASVVADVLQLGTAPSAKAERFDNDHLYAGGCRYLDAAGKTRALLAIKIDKGGHGFSFLPIREERSNLLPTKPVAKHKAGHHHDGALWWTSKEDVMFQLALYEDDGQSIVQDIDKHHAVAAKVMEGHPQGDLPDATAPTKPEQAPNDEQTAPEAS